MPTVKFGKGRPEWAARACVEARKRSGCCSCRSLRAAAAAAAASWLVRGGELGLLPAGGAAMGRSRTMQVLKWTSTQCMPCNIGYLRRTLLQTVADLVVASTCAGEAAGASWHENMTYVPTLVRRLEKHQVRAISTIAEDSSLLRLQ
jgi:hypothetical protein